MQAPIWATHVAKWISEGTPVTVWIANGLHQYVGHEIKEFPWGVDDWKRAIENPSYGGTVLPIEPIVLENK